jgi:hypothetical protein
LSIFRKQSDGRWGSAVIARIEYFVPDIRAERRVAAHDPRRVQQYVCRSSFTTNRSGRDTFSTPQYSRIVKLERVSVSRTGAPAFGCWQPSASSA